MQDNPFAPHSPAPVEAFVDRARELDLVFDHITAVHRGNVAINGPLGIGKTSLLRYIAHPQIAPARGVTQPEFALIYLDIQSVAPFSAVRFWHRVAELLARTPGVDLAEPARRMRERESPDMVDLEEFLDNLADRGTALVLLLDEFEWALQVDTAEAEAQSRNFLAQLASLARRTPRVLSLIVSTEAPLPEVTRVIESWRGSPFPTCFVATTLKPLARGDADQLFDLAEGKGQRLLTSDDRDSLYRLSGGQPAALQAAAFSLYHELRTGARGEQGREAARMAVVSALEALVPAPTIEAPPAGAETEPPDGAAAQQGLGIDTQTGDVYVDGRRVESLTALEYNLLRLLHAHAGRLCSKDEIIRQVWGTEFVGQIDDSRVEKLVSRLRRKIEPVPGRPQYVRTVRGRGYRFVP